MQLQQRRRFVTQSFKYSLGLAIGQYMSPALAGACVQQSSPKLESLSLSRLRRNCKNVDDSILFYQTLFNFNKYKNCLITANGVLLEFVSRLRTRHFANSQILTYEDHWAFAVKSQDFWCNKLNVLGIPYLVNEAFIHETQTRIIQIFFRDLDGNLIELVPHHCHADYSICIHHISREILKEHLRFADDIYIKLLKLHRIPRADFELDGVWYRNQENDLEVHLVAVEPQPRNLSLIRENLFNWHFRLNDSAYFGIRKRRKKMPYFLPIESRLNPILSNPLHEERTVSI